MKRIHPRVKFTGNRFADRLSIIFAETLEDLLVVMTKKLLLEYRCECL